MGEAETNKTTATPGGTPAPAKKSQLISSDAKPGAEDEPKYLVNNKPVSREEYMEALPRAGFVPERMPENYFPAISTE